MKLTKETEIWFANHIEHTAACRTVFWFLKGKMGLVDMIWFGALVAQKQIEENVCYNNPLFSALDEKKLIREYIPPV